MMNNGGVRDDPSIPQQPAGRVSVKTALVVVSVLLIMFAYTQLEGQFKMASSVQKEIEDANITWMQDHDRRNLEMLLETNCTFVESVSVATFEARNRLEQYWNISNYPNFKSMMNIPEESWSIQKAKFVKLILEAGSNRAASQSTMEAHKPKEITLNFIVGFSGSSVTAGHDNYFNESFPQVFARTLAPVFAALEVPLQVRNHALGNNPCYPYDACISTHLGEDLDILAWEQSMNCGRWSTPLDTFSRASSHMPKKPSLLFLTSGGPTWSRQDCAARNISGLSTARGALTAAELSLNAHTLKQNAQVNPFLEQFTFLKDPDGALLARRFASLASMAQSVFGCDEYKCLGPYTADFCEKTPGGGAPHHPGRLMHQLRGENLAYFYLSILAEALEDVRNLLACPRTGSRVSSSGTSSSSGGDYTKRSSSETGGSSSKQPAVRLRRIQQQQPHLEPTTVLRKRKLATSKARASTVQHISSVLNLTPPLPPPRTAQEGEKGPSSPSSSKEVYAVVLEYLRRTQSPPLPPVPVAYNISELSSPAPPQCHTNFEPRVQNALSEIVIARHSNWHSGLSFLDAAAVEKSILKGYGYVDRKYIYTSVGVNSTLAFTVRVSASATPVWLCEVQKGFAKYPSSAADLLEGAEVYVDVNQSTGSNEPALVPVAPVAPGNNTYTPPNIQRMKKIELSPFYIQCYRTSPLPPGTHTLVLVQKTDKMINLAYVVSW